MDDRGSELFDNFTIVSLMDDGDVLLMDDFFL